VILFKYDNARYYRNLTIFGGAQFLFWGWLSYMSLSPLTFEQDGESPSSPTPPISTPKHDDHWLVKFSRKFAELNVQGYLFFLIGKATNHLKLTKVTH
jgi:hypothetical protein